MGNALENLRHLIDCYAWRDSRDMQDFIDAADMIDMQYVELPKDANGIEIRVGDDMQVVGGHFAGEHSPVEYLAMTESGWEVDGDPPQSLRHYHAPNVEDIYQKAIRELNNLFDASVLLPVDADGVPIHVGDMMERGKARGHVVALMLSEYPKKWGGGLHWGVQLEGEQAPTALDLTFHHYRAPTVEDVLREFAEKVIDSQIPSVHPTYEEAIAEYASKLLLADDAAGPNELTMAYHVGYDDALAKRKPNASKVMQR